MPFSIEDKHTIKVLRQQKLYTEQQKYRERFRIKTVLSKTDATGNVERGHFEHSL